jgi:hypothetical protein
LPSEYYSYCCILFVIALLHFRAFLVLKRISSSSYNIKSCWYFVMLTSLISSQP